MIKKYKIEVKVDDDFWCIFCIFNTIDYGCKDQIPRQHCAAAREYIPNSLGRPDFCPLEEVDE